MEACYTATEAAPLSESTAITLGKENEFPAIPCPIDPRSMSTVSLTRVTTPVSAREAEKKTMATETAR